MIRRAAAGFTLHVADVPDDADLVMIGNPTNPTGVLHPSARLRALCRVGRVVVVVFLALAVLVSAFYFPLWTGAQVPFGFWQAHIWLPSWR